MNGGTLERRSGSRGHGASPGAPRVALEHTDAKHIEVMLWRGWVTGETGSGHGKIRIELRAGTRVEQGWRRDKGLLTEQRGAGGVAYLVKDRRVEEVLDAPL